MNERVRVKICGLTREADVIAAIEAGADYLGFIFAESPRRLCARDASRLVATARAAARGTERAIECVGVFVDEVPTVVEATREALGLDRLQLHGSESVAVCRALGEERIIKAFRVAPGERPDVGPSAAWAVLIDGRHASLAGGSGARADFDAAAAIAPVRRLFLAGGLDPWNVADAVRRVRPFAVDVSSGVESSPGVKDPARIRDFIAGVRAAEKAS